MARKARHRISYVLPLANSPGGHRLGVNGLAVDPELAILYSGGRDGAICAWNLNLELAPPNDNPTNPFASPEDRILPASNTGKTAFYKQVQAHTHWVNDVVLAQSNTVLVSASSDLTVKAWRPFSEENPIPATIGVHGDYVKRLATPGSNYDYVASGGLDHKIRLWDLDGRGQKLEINIGGDDASAKGSVYALSVRGSTMASGGPESTVRLWDARSGKRITNLVGHTDNVRDILISQDGDTVMTASSDQTVKVWSIAAGRCMYTLAMHNDSVWSLDSADPHLSLFYSADRSGLIAKTDVRRCEDMDQGLSIAVAQENGGVNKIVACADYFWTATSSSSINRWCDIDTEKPIQTPEQLQRERATSSASRTKVPSPPQRTDAAQTRRPSHTVIPLASVLRISNNAPIPSQRLRDVDSTTTYSGISARKLSEAIADIDLGIIHPLQELSNETIEGQNGLIKHLLLNDRRRVLTLDTAGEVTLWDLLKCVPMQTFGKRHLEDVIPEVNTVEAVANWCGVDTRTGSLTVVLEENYCFDAEMYADEWNLETPGDFREDQRINLGKWILRFLFARLIDEEATRDSTLRKRLSVNPSRLNDSHHDPPAPPPKDSLGTNGEDDFSITPKTSVQPQAPNGVARNANASLPLQNGASQTSNTQAGHLPSTAEERTSLEKRASQGSQPRSSIDKSADNSTSTTRPKSASENTGGDATTSSNTETNTPPVGDEKKDEKQKESSSLFGKKFRMNFPKKLGGRNSTDTRPPPLDEKAEESDPSEDREDRTIQDNFSGVITKIRREYDEDLQTEPSEPLISKVIPSPFSETPILRPPSSTTIIIQEEKIESGGIADLYRGTVGTVGQDADLVEKAAPMWLGELLLRNKLPPKEIAKVSFVLMPYHDDLPSIASSDGNNRLNANRMLRVKKILAYVAERIETPPENPKSDALKPEQYLELLCQNQVVDNNTTLATLRTHIWKPGGDVVLYYRSNGRRPELEQLAGGGSRQEASAKTGPVLSHSS